MSTPNELAAIKAELAAERAAGARLSESHRQLREQLATCREKPLRWSSDRPTVAGQWWTDRISGQRQMVRVFERPERSGLLWIELGEHDFWPVDSVMFNGWRWAGPLPEPVD